jgi:hypothetical protein
MNTLRQNLPLVVTAAIFAALFGAAGYFYDGFFSARVATSLLADNAFLGIAAVGMTLVIFSGGIDLSIGAVVGFTSIFTATLVSGHGVPPAVAWLLALALGAALGAAMGALIHVFRLPPFLITLAGMFFARGMAFELNTESVGIAHPLYEKLSNFDLALGDRAAVSRRGADRLFDRAPPAFRPHVARAGRQRAVGVAHGPAGRRRENRCLRAQRFSRRARRDRRHALHGLGQSGDGCRP